MLSNDDKVYIRAFLQECATDITEGDFGKKYMTNNPPGYWRMTKYNGDMLISVAFGKLPLYKQLFASVRKFFKLHS